VVPIARRSLAADRFRLLLSVLGVALSIMLILVLQGLFAGVNEQVTAYLENSSADVVAAERGLNNFLGARSVVSNEDLDIVRADPDVREVVPVVVQYVVLELGGRREFMLLVGFDPETGGGPWEMARGSSAIDDEGLILDEVTANRHNLSPGDQMDVLGTRLTVRGVSGGTSSWMTGTLFVTADTGSRILGTGGMPAFGHVRLADGADPERVASRNEDATDMTITTRTDMSANDIELYAAVFNGPLALMVGIAFLVGVSLVGLTIHTATVERTKEYGALKAIGIGNSALYTIVAKQAGLASAAGLALGVALTYGVKIALESIAPQFLVVIDTSMIAQVAIVAFVMSGLAALLPARAIAQIDPAIAFRKGT
jgi:putative ABC transport system permease protein